MILGMTAKLSRVAAVQIIQFAEVCSDGETGPPTVQYRAVCADLAVDSDFA